MDFWFVSYKVRSRNGDTYAGHKIVETEKGISPQDALEFASVEVAKDTQADVNAVRILAFNRV